MSDPFSLDARFRIIRPLGRGGIGTVFEAEDLKKEMRVALKTLRGRGSEKLFSLKHEFRSLAGLHHPNIAVLFDLFTEGDEPFFTMEFVEGADVSSYCREPLVSSGSPPPVWPEQKGMACDEDRLRQVLPQIHAGLTALHEVGTLHRDLKPENVLVTPEGQVKILDFGLAAEVSELANETTAGQMVGTRAYASPEQTEGEVALTPASDWYSVGVILYELLTGCLPSQEGHLEASQEEREKPVGSPSSVFSGVPDDLAQLCVDLLNRVPRDRPGAAEVLQRITTDGKKEIAQVETAETRPLFAGRREEIARIEAAFGQVPETGARVILIKGRSGIGKTALVNEALTRLAAENRGLLVLSGRCYERENVPFRAMDGVIDELSRFWRNLPDINAGALLPRDAGLLRHLFPVLGRVPAIAGEPDPVALEDPNVRRDRAYAALRETFHRLATRKPLIIFLDNLQWIDRDSVNLLGDLLRSPDPPPFLLLLASRDYSGERAPLMPELLKALGTTLGTVDLGPLPVSDCHELASHLVGAADPEQVDQVVQEADGNPFLVEELARYVRKLGGSAPSLRLEDVFASRQASLKPGPRRVMECVCVAGDPVPEGVLRRAANLDPAPFQDAIQSLVSGQLIRSASGDKGEHYETYHDRIREIAVSALSTMRRAEIHRSLAVALDSWGEASAAQLARHWSAGEDGSRAALYARTAGDDAAATSDFDAAAGWYRSALDHGEYDGDESREVWTSLGQALGYAGRPKESADAYAKAAEGADRVTVLELRRRSLEQLLGGGYVAPGLDAARELLKDVGLSLPATPAGTIFTILRNEVLNGIQGLKWTPRPESDLSVDRMAQAYITLTVGMNLSNIDTLRANAVMGKGLRLALRLGAPSAVVQGCAVASCMASALGNAKRAERLLKVATHAASLDGSPHSKGMAAAAKELQAFFIRNHWRSAIELGTEALEYFWEEGVGRRWESDLCLIYRCFARLYHGDLLTLREEVSEHVRSAERSGNLLLNVNLRTGLRIRHLLDDDPEAAEVDLRESIDSWLPEEVSFQVQHWYAFWGRCELALYTGEVETALVDLDETRRRFERSLLSRVARLRCEYRHVWGRLLLARAAKTTSGAERGEDVRVVRGLAQKLEGEGLPMAQFMAGLLRASAAHVLGDDAEAVDALRHEVVRLDESQTMLYAAAAKFRLGTLLYGDEGAEFIRTAEEWMTGQGIQRPDRMTAMLIPGWMYPG
jgi:tRNA A-37 threonylcarbamoyl transferase component Bud32/tetratricopeptide (TPR) repeat protein